MTEETTVLPTPETGEQLKKTVECTVLPNGQIIIKVPDTDEGKFVHMTYRETKGNDMLQTKGGDEILEQIMGGCWEFVDTELNVAQKDRLNTCVNELFLPTPLALYLALDSNEDLANYPRPEKGIKQPITVAITGEPADKKSGKGVGKSLLSAAISRKLNLLVVSFESLYAENAELYAYVLGSAGWPSEGNDSYGQAIEIVNQAVWNNGTKKERIGELRGLGSLFEDKLQPFRESANRSEGYIFDMPGEPRKVRDIRSGEVIENTRTYKNTELLSATGCEVGVFTGRQLVPKQMERKVTWILATIDSALSQNGEARIRRNALASGVAVS